MSFLDKSLTLTGIYIEEPIFRSFVFKPALRPEIMFSTFLVFSGLDTGDRQVLEQKYQGSDPPCLLDSSDGR